MHLHATFNHLIQFVFQINSSQTLHLLVLEITLLFVTIQLFPQKNEPVFFQQARLLLFFEDISLQMHRVFAFTAVTTWLANRARETTSTVGNCMADWEFTVVFGIVSRVLQFGVVEYCPLSICFNVLGHWVFIKLIDSFLVHTHVVFFFVKLIAFEVCDWNYIHYGLFVQDQIFGRLLVHINIFLLLLVILNVMLVLLFCLCIGFLKLKYSLFLAVIILPEVWWSVVVLGTVHIVT